MLRLFAILQIILMFSAAIAGVRSPEIGVIGLKDWTKDEDLKNPYGVGFYVFQPVSENVRLTFEFDYLTSQTTDRLYIFDSTDYCDVIKVFRRNHVCAYQAGVRHIVCHSRSTFLEMGGGLCLVRFAANTHIPRTGERWSSADIDKWGPVLDIGLLVTNLKDLPITMRFGFRHRFLGGSAEMTCGGASLSRRSITTTEISWGFGYQFGRQKPASTADSLGE